MPSLRLDMALPTMAVVSDARTIDGVLGSQLRIGPEDQIGVAIRSDSRLVSRQTGSDADVRCYAEFGCDYRIGCRCMLCEGYGKAAGH